MAKPLATGTIIGCRGAANAPKLTADLIAYHKGNMEKFPGMRPCPKHNWYYVREEQSCRRCMFVKTSD